IVSLGITPPLATVPLGLSAQLVATASYSDGTTADVSAQATWSVSPESVASVKGGLVTALAAGTAKVSATYDGQGAAAQIPVPAAAITSVAVTPPNATTGTSGSVKFSAIATFGDGSKQDITASAAWSSSDPNVAVVTAGVATGIAAGTATI